MSEKSRVFSIPNRIARASSTMANDSMSSATLKAALARQPANSDAQTQAKGSSNSADASSKSPGAGK